MRLSSLDFCVRSHEFDGLLEMQAGNKTYWWRLSVSVAVVAVGRYSRREYLSTMSWRQDPRYQEKN